ncbi:MAG: HPr family phosphocarrier protein [Oscillospiraceae bacterium]|nr:HPr family phosphocarrier protein [Oscillospiraceae bacterium]
MYVTTVFLPEIADVAEFVNIMSQFRFEAQLHVGNYAVDAKSIMGIFTLDREQPLQLEAEVSDEAQIEKLNQAIGRFLFHPVH